MPTALRNRVFVDGRTPLAARFRGNPSGEPPNPPPVDPPVKPPPKPSPWHIEVPPAPIRPNRPPRSFRDFEPPPIQPIPSKPNPWYPFHDPFAPIPPETPRLNADDLAEILDLLMVIRARPRRRPDFEMPPPPLPPQKLLPEAPLKLPKPDILPPPRKYTPRYKQEDLFPERRTPIEPIRPIKPDDVPKDMRPTPPMPIEPIRPTPPPLPPPPKTSAQIYNPMRDDLLETDRYDRVAQASSASGSPVTSPGGT